MLSKPEMLLQSRGNTSALPTAENSFGVYGSKDGANERDFSQIALSQWQPFDHTRIGHKLGFGPSRKLPRFNDRKRLCIINTEPFAIVESRGFGAVQIPSLWPILVYMRWRKLLAIPEEPNPARAKH